MTSLQQKDFNLILATADDLNLARQQPWWPAFVYEKTITLGLNVDRNSLGTLEEIQTLTDVLVEVHDQLSEANQRAELLEVLKFAKARQDELLKDRLQESMELRVERKQAKIETRKARGERWEADKRAHIVYNGTSDVAAWSRQEGSVEKLEALGLPVVTTPQELSALLEVSFETLRAFASVPKVSKVQRYVTFDIPKKTGGTRTISAPRSILKQMQRSILDGILHNVPLHDAAHGFVPKRSIRSNAEPHVQSKIVINMDLQDFFPSMTYARTKGVFTQLGYSEEIASILSTLCTHAETLPFKKDGQQYYLRRGPLVLPQGAPTSPTICNIACRRLDARLSGLATKLGFTYTRYADDLTFTSKDSEAPVAAVLGLAKHIVEEEQFVVHPNKTRVMRTGRRQEVTGLVVNDGLGIEKRRLKRFRALLHHLETKGLDGAHWEGSANILDSALGFAAFVYMVKDNSALLERTKTIVQKLKS